MKEDKQDDFEIVEDWEASRESLKSVAYMGCFAAGIILSVILAIVYLLI